MGSEGGAISEVDGIIINSSFVNNSADNGGAINGDFYAKNCLFAKNSANTGGALYTQMHGPHLYLDISICVFVVNCSFVNNYGSQGGAIYSCGYLNITNCSLINNSADTGGAFYSFTPDIVKNCLFANNSAYTGGAVYIDDKMDNRIGEPDFMNCSFVNNSAIEGGGVYLRQPCSYHKYTIIKCSFIDNAAYYGGAIYCDDNTWGGDYFNISIIMCSFIDNLAFNDGGAIYINASNVEIKNGTFIGNNASRYGGAVNWKGSNGSLNNCHFINNFLTDQISSGGAIYWKGVNGSVVNCRFIDNSANSQGGAIYWIYYGNGSIVNCSFINNSAYEGGAINVAANNVEIKNGTFIGNNASYAGAIYWYSNQGNGSIIMCSFIDNLAFNDGGAIYINAGNVKIKNGYFIGNNATFGSAIYTQAKYANNKFITKIYNTTFVYNQAHSTSIIIRNENGKFIATFKAKDNILNAIWNNGTVDCIFIDGVNPKDGVENSNNGQLLYQDDREFNQKIIATILDNNGNILESANLITNIYGEVEYTPLKKGTKIKFAHPEDVFYKAIENITGIPYLTIQKTPTKPKVCLGEDIEFEITIKNNGNIQLTNIILTEHEFKDLTYKDYIKSNSWTYHLINGINTWTLNHALNPGETETLKVIFTAPKIGTYNNTAFANATNVRNNYAKASVEVISNLILEKFTLTNRVYENETAEFLITVTNIGNLAASNIFIEDSDYSKYLEFINWTSQKGNWTFDKNNMKWHLADNLQTGESASIIVKFKALHTGELRNNATTGINNLTLKYSYNTTEVLHHHNNNNTIGNRTHNESDIIIDDPDTPDEPDIIDNPDTPDTPNNPEKDDEPKSTSHSSGYIDSHATGNPIIVLFLALLSLVLIRRKD